MRATPPRTALEPVPRICLRASSIIWSALVAVFSPTKPRRSCVITPQGLISHWSAKKIWTTTESPSLVVTVVNTTAKSFGNVPTAFRKRTVEKPTGSCMTRRPTPPRIPTSNQPGGRLVTFPRAPVVRVKFCAHNWPLQNLEGFLFYEFFL